MKYTPLNDYIIVNKLESAKTTASGIILQASTGADNAVVVAVSASEACKSLEVGDVVMIRWSNALKINGDTYAVDFKEVVTKLS